MRLHVYPDRPALGAAAAAHAARLIRQAIDARGTARIVAATGTSQIEFLDRLVGEPGIAWRRVELFHLDEYIGIAIDHPASFRRYLLDRFIGKAGIVRYHLLDGERDPARIADEAGRALAASPVDVTFAGIGENGHLAFNDPPADFDTDRPYIIVALDEACRRQQVGEGWFADLDDVPTHAISMSIRQILKSREIVCVVPEARKADAVKACVEGDVSPLAPASILRTHPKTTLFLDEDSAGRLSAGARKLEPE
jgi:glucosamine-6-phosphate deaminase